MTIGEQIYTLRTSANMTQKELAEAIGSSQSAINYWENNKRTPRFNQLCKIASYFNIPVQNFLSADEVVRYDIETKTRLETDRQILNKLYDLKEKQPEREDTDKAIEILEEIYKDNEESRELIFRFIHTLQANDELTQLFESLNQSGQIEALKQLQLLAKIPEYRKDDTPDTEE